MALAAPAAEAAPTQVIVLPGATSAEAITAGPGTTFYAADQFEGDIYRGDIRRGKAELFIDTPPRTATTGLALDARHDLLFAAGGDSGKAFVYNVRTRALVTTYPLGDPQTSIINDVTLTPFGAWFTDSLQPKLYFVPVLSGVPGRVHTLNLSGPAAGEPGAFHVNDITSTPSGNTLLVSVTLQGKVCKVNPFTGASELVTGLDAPNVDGLVLDGHRLWAVESFGNRVSRWRLSDDLGSAKPDGAIADPNFGVPLTAAKFGSRLAVMNSHLDTGFPPTSPTYEVVVVDS
jgi:sugar lactone lactonase YvrE